MAQGWKEFHPIAGDRCVADPDPDQGQFHANDTGVDLEG